MFMSFLISMAPFFTVASWAFFKLDKNFLASLFGYFDFNNVLIAFCRTGSVGLTARIFFAANFDGNKRYASIPAFATFSAP